MYSSYDRIIPNSPTSNEKTVQFIKRKLERIQSQNKFSHFRETKSEIPSKFINDPSPTNSTSKDYFVNVFSLSKQHQFQSLKNIVSPIPTKLNKDRDTSTTIKKDLGDKRKEIIRLKIILKELSIQKKNFEKVNQELQKEIIDLKDQL